MYSQLVFYVEACEAGSMFASMLASNINIYVTTASNPSESSWGTFCPPQDRVNGKDMGTCLGDTYSINWMQDADRVAKLKRNQTLQIQYAITRKETNQSHVMQYGDKAWTNEPITDFEGQPSPSSSSSSSLSPAAPPFVHLPHSHYGGHRGVRVPSRTHMSLMSEDDDIWSDVERETLRTSAVDSRDIALHIAYYRYLRAAKSDIQERRALLAQLQGTLARRAQIDDHFFAITLKLMGASYEKAQSVLALPTPAKLPPTECVEQSIMTYETRCGRLDDYGLQYMRVLTNLCTIVPASDLIKVIASVHCVPAN
jgi:legumain